MGADDFAVRSAVLPAFYADLRDRDFVSPFAVFHRHFSTNAAPKVRALGL